MTALKKSRVYRGLISSVLRAGRITRYSPSWKGYNHLLRLYARCVPEDLRTRIRDFDGDLVLDVNVRGKLDLSLWHFPNLYDKELREMFCAAVTPGCTVLDVGAHIGMYTLLAAKRGAQVFAVEADPLNAAMLRHHVALNGFAGRVTIFEMAAIDTIRPVTLYRHPFSLAESNIVGAGALCGTVEGKTLDSLNLPPIDVCKMDIEGAELQALKGFQKTLARSPRIKLFVEYASQYGSAAALLAYLRSTFSEVNVVEQGAVTSSGEIPGYCNLIATQQKA